MFDSISLINFKSYREATLPLAPLTLLIGAHASGKSNAIEGLRLLPWLAHGQRLDDLVSAVQSDAQRVRRTVADLIYHEPAGEKPERPLFGFDCHSTLELSKGWKVNSVTFQIRLEITAGGIRVAAESLDWLLTSKVSRLPLYEVVEAAGEFSHEVSMRYNNFARGGKKPQITCSDQQAIFTQLGTPARFSTPAARRDIPRAVNALRQFFERILFLDPNPRAMRQYSFVVEKKLTGDGSNLSSVLFDLCQERDRKAAVLDFIRALPEQDIRDIGFLEGPRKEVMVTLAKAFGGRERHWDAGILSDGTLRVLAVAAALLSAPQGSLVVIEEIDSGVHPSRAGMLLENILNVAESRKLHALITTHNPALLDALPAAAIPNLVCCYRDPDTGMRAPFRPPRAHLVL